MKHAKIFIISGPSGSGKTTLYQRLLASHEWRGRLAKSISMTTRPKRPGEKHGKDYFFVSRKMFLHKISAGHFLEHEQVFNNYYGTPKAYVKKLLKSGCSVLLCIDVLGAETVRRKFNNTVSIFIKPPSLRILKERLSGRGSEDMALVAVRLNRVRQELAESKKYDYVITNRDLSRAFVRLKGIIRQKLSCCCS